MFSFLTLCWERSLVRFWEWAAFTDCCSYWHVATLGFPGLLAPQGRSPKSHCWPLQDQFLILFSRTRLKIVPCPAADWLNEPWVFFWMQCALYRWPNSMWCCSAFWHPTSAEFKVPLISTFLLSGPYMLCHGSCHEPFDRFITFHCAKQSRYLASLSVPSV